MPTWAEIKAMPSLKRLRKNQEYRTARMRFVKPAPPKIAVTHREVRVMHDSTRAKRARAARAENPSA